MKPATFIKVSVSFSIMLGVAAAGAVLYANDASALRGEAGEAVSLHLQTEEPTAATIAAWKASARASDYMSPRVPI